MKNLVLILAFYPLFIFGQKQTVQKIDSTIQAYQFLIESYEADDLDFYPPHFTISSSLMERAIGLVNTTTTIYFDLNENENETDVEDVPVIRMVDVNIHSGSYQISKTFFYNELGVFQYYFYKEIGYDCYQLEYYFNQLKPILIKQKSLKTNECKSDSIIEDRNTSKLTKQDLILINVVKDKANDFNRLLNQYLKCLD